MTTSKKGLGETSTESKNIGLQCCLESWKKLASQTALLQEKKIETVNMYAFIIPNLRFCGEISKYYKHDIIVK